MADDRQAARDQMAEAYARLFTSELGQPVFEDMKASAFFVTTTAVADTDGRIDPAHTLLREGARSFVLAVQEQVTRGLTLRADRTASHAIPSVPHERKEP